MKLQEIHCVDKSIGAPPCWNRKGSAKTICYKITCTQFSRISLYGVALRFVLTEMTKVVRPVQQKGILMVFPIQCTYKTQLCNICQTIQCTTHYKKIQCADSAIHILWKPTMYFPITSKTPFILLNTVKVSELLCSPEASFLCYHSLRDTFLSLSCHFIPLWLLNSLTQ